MSKRVLGSVRNKVVATELQEERDSGPKFDRKEMTMALWKYDWVYEQVQHDFDLMEKHPILANNHKFYDSSRHELNMHWMKKVNFMANYDRKYFFNGYCHPLYSWGVFHQG